MSETHDTHILFRPLQDEVKESYTTYSMSVIRSRALPDARDGLKPSQRRILYAMRLLSLSPTGKHRKCAKICGDTSGDYHPHGESVVYPTLVRMGQDWAMRYCLVDKQGNFGSIDGDPPAAMRYTEARLTPSAMALMEDLEEDTVDMVPNYDETKVEPSVMPSKFPQLLVNGASGIAVGMATNIPPHNLIEVINGTKMLIDNPDTTVEELMQVIPGPDFPTGGIICGYAGIKKAYHDGRGLVIVRAKIDVEEMGISDRQQLVITEIPYNVNKSLLIQRIAELVNDKDGDKLNGVSDIRDESDKDGMRLVIELKRNEMPDVTINQLYKYTDMQTTFGCNMLTILNNQPVTMNLKQLIGSWIEHRIEVVRRRTKFRLAKAEARAHILEGYLKALDNLDEVVKIIRSSSNREDAKKELRSRFDFSERQVNAVLDLRLYQLTGMEYGKIDAEYQELLISIADYREILASETRVRTIIKDELVGLLKSKFHQSDRRTQIIPAEGEFRMEDLIKNEKVIIVLTSDNYIKRMPLDTFRVQKRGGMGVSGMKKKKEDDVLKAVYVANTHQYLLVFTNLGKCHWIKVWEIPEVARQAKGKAIVNLLQVQEGEEIAAVLPVVDFEGDESILMVTQQGVVKKTLLDEYSNPRKKGINAITIREDDRLIGAYLVSGEKQVMLFTREGMAVRFDHTEVRNMGRNASGVCGAKLKNDADRVVSCEIVDEDDAVLVVCENGFGKRSRVSDFRKTSRGAKGVKSINVTQRNGFVLGAVAVKSDEDTILMMAKSGQTVRTSMKDIRVMGRSTSGVNLVKLMAGDLLVTMQKIAFEEPPEELLDEDGVSTKRIVNALGSIQSKPKPSLDYSNDGDEDEEEELAEEEEIDDDDENEGEDE